MKRLLINGGLLAIDFFAQTSTAVSHWPSEFEVGVTGVGVIGVLLSLNHFASDAFAALTEHGETSTV